MNDFEVDHPTANKKVKTFIEGYENTSTKRKVEKTPGRTWAGLENVSDLGKLANF